MLLSGHLHGGHVGHTADRYRIDGVSALIVQAGTATSKRTRDEPNSFNVLRVSPRHIEVETWVLRGADFTLERTEAFDHRDDGWARAGGGTSQSLHGPA